MNEIEKIDWRADHRGFNNVRCVNHPHLDADWRVNGTALCDVCKINFSKWEAEVSS